jgi:hypothetical protein
MVEANHRGRKQLFMKTSKNFTLCISVSLIVPAILYGQPSSESHSLEESIQTALHDPSKIGWLIALVGLTTAAAVDFAKDMLGMRRFFNRWAVRSWIRRRIYRIRRDVVEVTNPYRIRTFGELRSGEAVEEFENLAGADDGKRYPLFYALPVENVCGQLAAAGEVAIGSPEIYVNSFSILVGVGHAFSPYEIQEYLKLCSTRAGRRPIDDFEARKFSDEDRERYGNLRSRFMVQAQRSLDNLQVDLSRKWRIALVLLSIYASLIFSLWVVKVNERAINYDAHLSMYLFVAAGGVAVAPLAHDLMRAVRSFRRL